MLRKKRSEIDEVQRQAAAMKAAELFLVSPWFQKCQHFAFYAPCHNEFDTQPLIDMIWRAKKNCYLPVLASDKTKTLAFYSYAQNDALIANQYGIPEPTTQDKSPFPLEKLEVVFVPVVGFDLKCHRLGTGGGYYDRSFAFLLSQTKPRSPCLIGLAYLCQAVDLLPVDTWDVPLDGILTEKKLIL